MSDLYWMLWSCCSLSGLECLPRVLWILLNNVYVIPAYFVWLMLFLPVYFVQPAAYHYIEQVFFGWLLEMVACWSYTAGYDVIESGDALEDVVEENFLFMPNHQSTADVPLCMTLFAARPHFADKVMWIMDKVFKYSNFGLVSWMHDDFFILAGKDNRTRSLVDLQSHLQKVFVHKARKYLVLFPEGGFLRKRKSISQRYAQKNNLPLLEHCTLPRTGALEVILNVLGPQAGQVNLSLVDEAVGSNNNDASSPAATTGNGSVPSGWQSWRQGCFFKDYLTKVIDVTICYPDGMPLDLVTIITASRPPCTTRVHYRVFDIDQLPSDSEGIKKWMYDLYVEKEKMLEEFSKTGIFPFAKYPSGRPGQSTAVREPRPLLVSPKRFLLLHLFFLVSTALFFVYLPSMIWSALQT